uniref:SHSP domain-containing protein n=1 Tax=Compsopogon caeruleus TaxID=31354 RepID=A0A7S1TGR7_9RHOD|mmetsp:Transcript_6632/g.13459  ORF Transcript_6632/g.13459 Transcript_6632/m.13459 type:complete len:196 (+) Transcript_6632:80-667(+)|eukprot:CAMPEP_0184685346 /NCGR_PEP_ID=MMETSP0312-20130426/18668_1 /TAXON_ID=31354 /ORGANISM="Compsopogon coeruleus, Strain SAG 36.94" /LENGTH=195 /DNA_ID=CAMNT_0027139375 /DNA_START=77 /DNA_END=664 /DNA_ORIENTATION=-
MAVLRTVRWGVPMKNEGSRRRKSRDWEDVEMEEQEQEQIKWEEPKWQRRLDENGVVHLWIELPGVKKEDLSLEVKDGCLSVTGERSKRRKVQLMEGEVVVEDGDELCAEGGRPDTDGSPIKKGKSSEPMVKSEEREKGTKEKEKSVPSPTEKTYHAIIKLGKLADTSKINATLRHGLLTLTVPQVRPTPIQIPIS